MAIENSVKVNLNTSGHNLTPMKENPADIEAKNMASHLISNFDPSQRVDILESMREIIYNNLKEVVADKRSVLEDYEQNLKRLEEGI